MLFWGGNCDAQQKKEVHFDSLSVVVINGHCHKPKYRWENGKVLRRYLGSDYTLIDTSGLIIYTKLNEVNVPVLRSWALFRHNVGYYSDDVCGKIYDLDYKTLKPEFKTYKAFLKKLNHYNDNDYLSIGDSTGITQINEWYLQLVKGR